jgi:hypothetical protein
MGRGRCAVAQDHRRRLGREGRTRRRRGHARRKFGDGLGKLAGVAGARSPSTRSSISARQAFDAASNLEQMAGSVDAVFGESAVADRTSSPPTRTRAVGLSTADYDQLASVIGSQLQNAGGTDRSTSSTPRPTTLIKKGADMSAVFGGSAADAVDALSSVIKGEFDPIEKYGVSSIRPRSTPSSPPGAGQADRRRAQAGAGDRGARPHHQADRRDTGPVRRTVGHRRGKVTAARRVVRQPQGKDRRAGCCRSSPPWQRSFPTRWVRR